MQAAFDVALHTLTAAASNKGRHQQLDESLRNIFECRGTIGVRCVPARVWAYYLIECCLETAITQQLKWAQVCRGRYDTTTLNKATRGYFGVARGTIRIDLPPPPQDFDFSDPFEKQACDASLHEDIAVADGIRIWLPFLP